MTEQEKDLVEGDQPLEATEHTEDNSVKLETTYEESSYSYQGPLPPAEHLQQYELIVPGSARELFDTFKQEVKHNRELEQKKIDLEVFYYETQAKSESRNSLLGIISGFIIGMTAISLGTWLAFNGHEVSGTILGGSALVGLVSAFIYGTRTREPEVYEVVDEEE
jgi:uncharacterized membrane protein